MSLTLDLPTGRRGQLLAVGLAVAVLGLVWTVAAAPVIAWHTERTEQLERQRNLAERMAALAETLPELRRQANGSNSDGSATAGAALLATGRGGTAAGGDAVAAAALQGRLQEMVMASGVVLVSTEALPAEVLAGGLRRIGLRVAITARWVTLVQLLEAISSSTAPRMLVDDLQLRAPDLMRQRPVAMEASFILFAYRSEAAVQ